MNQRGVTTLELLMVIVIIGILSMVTMTEFFKVHNRAYVGAAMSDLQIIRKALSMHDAEWGIFPGDAANDMIDLVTQLTDPFGLPYIDPPSGENWREFHYLPPDPGDFYGDYDLTVVCKDHFNTQITVHWNQDVDIVRLGAD